MKVLPNPHDRFSKEQMTTGFGSFMVVENAISEKSANDLILYGQDHVLPASNKHNHKFSIKVDTCWLPDDHPIYKELDIHWKAAIDYFKFDVEFLEPLELKKYPIGGHYEKHIDNYHGMTIPVDRKISMSLQLSDDTEYEGGELVIVRKVASKKKLTATFFPSFYPHHVNPVINGTRWVMIGWAWGPYWK